MKRLHILVPLLLLALSCVRELDAPMEEDGGSRVIDFGFCDIDDITISTRMALNEAAEQRVVNMYVLLFDNTGKRVFGQYLDTDNRFIYPGSIDDSEATQDNYLSEHLVDSGKQWYVINHATNKGLDHRSHGKICLKMPDVSGGGEIHIIANLDPALMDVSKERLNYVTSRTQLEALVVSLTHQTGFRSGAMLMHGYATGVKIVDGKIDRSELTGGTLNESGGETIKHNPSIFLKRLDARITVNVNIDPTHETENSDGTKQRVKSFTPESWQIINIPASAKLYSGTVSAPSYFSSIARPFESTEGMSKTEGDKTYTWDQHSFEYYQLESYPGVGITIPTGGITVDGKTVSALQLRDRKKKNLKGEIEYDTDGNPQWQYAPEKATYMIIKGEVMLDPIVADGDYLKNKTMNAQVVYYIHLGDWRRPTPETEPNYNDFTVQRNNHYTYNITIRGVNNIEYEVVYDNTSWTAANEQNSGAEGGVYRTKEGLFKCDSHFEQRVFPFAAEAMTGKTLTWYTSSPFGRAGSPDRVGADGIEIPTGLDYKWVHFHINSKFDQYKDLVEGTTKSYASGVNDGAGGVRKNRYYIPESAQVDTNPFWAGYSSDVGRRTEIPYLMDVVEFCKLLREQNALYAKEKADGVPLAERKNIFDDPNYGVEEESGNLHRIYVTVFVDEYYYNSHPTSNSPIGWSDFVGAADRVMHILCDSYSSTDDESFLSNSVVSVMQRSIQSIYKPYAAASGWGIETIDETSDINFFWNGAGTYDSEDTVPTDPNPPLPAHKHNDASNGLFNSAAWWNLLNSSGVFETGHKWQTYLDYARANKYEVKGAGLDASLLTENGQDIHFLKDHPQVANLRFACMSRNRDENGDGLIDASEVKWYLASQNQLALLYVGDSGLRPEAKLYQNGAKGSTKVPHCGRDVHPWRQHVISSTSSAAGTGSAPIMVWAEEGTSTTGYNVYSGNDSKPSFYYIRCVRNLGMDPETETDAQTAIAAVNNLPKTLATVKHFNMGTADDTSDDVYCFDLTNLNEYSVRNAAIVSDEGVFPGDENSYQARPYYGFLTGPLVSNANTYSVIKTDLERGTLICPDNYHVPNIRESSLMRFYVGSPLITGTLGVSSYYSFGTYGNQYDGAGYATWLTSGSIALAQNGGNFKPTGFRCIRDLELDEIAEVVAAAEAGATTPPAL